MFLTVLLIITLSLLFVKWKLSYWKRKNVPYIDTCSIWGNVGNPVTRKVFLGVIYANIYETFKKQGQQHVGVYAMLARQYLPIDLDLVKKILQNDFDHFEDRGFYYNEKDDPVSAHLFAIGGEKWRVLRAKISPAFTKAKIKSMFNIIMQSAEAMNLAIENQKLVDIKNLSARFTIDVIGSCGLGIECSSFKSDQSDFLHQCKLIISEYNILKNLLYAFATNFPSWGCAFGIKVLSKKCSKFFKDVTEATLVYRQNNRIKRNDAFQALMDLDDELTVNEIAAQCLIFFIAGFETSSSTLAYCLYELSRNPEIQEKTRKEVLLVISKYNGEITFEAIEEMKYLEQVVYETLRKYPPVAFFTRTCTKDYKVPNLDLVIEKGTRIIFPVLGIHHDEEYYPDPEKFDPDRFSEQNEQKIPPFSYLPFGEGPRKCLGRLFGLIEVKIGLSMLLKDYFFAVNPTVKYPLSWVTISLTLQSLETIWLDVQKIST